MADQPKKARPIKTDQNKLSQEVVRKAKDDMIRSIFVDPEKLRRRVNI